MILEYFTAPWCAPCKTMLPMVEDVCKESDFLVRVWDYNTPQGIAQAERRNVLGFPTMVLCEFKGERGADGSFQDSAVEYSRHQGVMGRGDFERWIKGEE